jgi:phosphopantetheinyl transferase (holo-ACP synthase)
MISTGNDIISLNAINIARTKQEKFYSKILSPTEKELYNQAEFASIPFENFVWLLWSIKESAYKYLKRNNPGLVFIPIKFTVKQLLIPTAYALTNFETTQLEGIGFNNIPAVKGVINIGDDTLYSNSLIYQELIVSVANSDENFENTHWGLKLINEADADYQSLAVREFMVERLQEVLHLDGLVIGKNTIGIPTVLKEGEELEVAVSLSHHDKLVAYSFDLRHSFQTFAT